MAGNEPDKHEKTEPATPHKLEDARKKGSVNKSIEVNTLVILAAGLVFLIAAGQLFINKTLLLSAKMFRQSSDLNFELGNLAFVTTDWVVTGATIMAPLAALVIVVGVLATLVQTGPVFTTHPIKPDIQRINPVAGFKRLISIKLLFELIKNLVKLTLFALVIYFTLTAAFEFFVSFYQKPHTVFVSQFIDNSATLIFRLLLVLALIAVIDRVFSGWDYKRNLKMTPKELKDEIKRREGDPLIRQKRKQLEGEMRSRAEAVNKVPEADLLITNPTHFAVLIKYDRSTMVAPEVIGKGAGAMAKLLKERAYQYRVPVIRSPLLARQLFKNCQLDKPIPESSYVAVAKLLRQSYAIKRQNDNAKLGVRI